MSDNVEKSLQVLEGMFMIFKTLIVLLSSLNSSLKRIGLLQQAIFNVQNTVCYRIVASLD